MFAQNLSFRGREAAACAALAVTMFAFDAGGADHFDGDETSADPTGDIADFYAFPDGDKLALVMNVHPRAGDEAFFSDVIEYTFRLRSGTLVQTDDGVATRPGGDEYLVTCTFPLEDPNADELSQSARCGLSHDGELLQATIVGLDDESGGDNKALRVYAGLRADPFFTDAGRIRLPRPRYKSLPGFISTGNAMEADRLSLGVIGNGPEETKGDLPNVLSIAIQLDRDLLPLGDQLALVAETNRRVGGAR